MCCPHRFTNRSSMQIKYFYSPCCFKWPALANQRTRLKCVGRTVESFYEHRRRATARKLYETQISKFYSSPTPMLFIIGSNFAQSRQLLPWSEKIFKMTGHSRERSWTNEFCGFFLGFFCSFFQFKTDLAWNSITVRDPTFRKMWLGFHRPPVSIDSSILYGLLFSCCGDMWYQYQIDSEI